jgi:hypothetical protein
MKKLVVLLAAAVLAAASVAVAHAALNDAKGPTCVDITNADFSYSADGTTATVNITVDAASCTTVTYKLFAQDSAADTTIVNSAGVPGDGTEFAPNAGFDVVTVNVPIPAGEQDGSVCLYATTSIGRHLFDRAPDSGSGMPNGSGCVELIPGGTGGGGGWN